jgi:uncharacterized protein (TIGR02391 family)
MARLQTTRIQTAPTLTPQRAIGLLRQQLERLTAISTAHSGSDSDASVWQKTTLAILKQAFGEPHQMVNGFHMPAMPFVTGMPPSYFDEVIKTALTQQRGIVESSIEQLEILSPPSASMPVGNYSFHAEIERVSGPLFRDGHFKQAALEAYIRVIDEVKTRSNLALDGDQLMNQAFSFDNGRTPILKFNTFASDAEKDEQRGFMFLFKGIVGQRNFKAHSKQLFNDPFRAHEYLAMASLLMRMLDTATT